MNVSSGCAKDHCQCQVLAQNNLHDQIKIKGAWDFICRDAQGNIKWTDRIDNMVVNVGLNYALGAALVGTTQILTWYVGLLSSSPTILSSDTMSSHGGWTEDIHYSESTRPTWHGSAVSSQMTSNVDSPAIYTINSNITIGGGFLVSVGTKNTSTGTLYAAGAFNSGDRTLVSSDRLSVITAYTLSHT